MADDRINSEISDDHREQIQLEAKRKSDGSWHPCRISLRYSGGLAVKFEGQYLEDVIHDVEDAFFRLRVCSSPLVGDDCSYIEGKDVLAVYSDKNSEGFFFDAVVKKVSRVRHSKRAFCRCTFMIKFQDFETDSWTVPSGSIMKLAAESIKSHPVVAEFLNSVESPPLSTLVSPPSFFGENECEIDLHGLLGEQIKEIGTLADVLKKDFPEDALLGGDFGVACGRREAQTKLLASEHVNKLRVEGNGKHNNLRRSARRQKEIETTNDDLLTTSPTYGEDSKVNRSSLNPLAARAVLASLVSETPQKVEFHHREEGTPVSMWNYVAHDHVSSDITNGMTMPGVYNSPPLHKFDSKPVKLVDNVKSLRKTKEGAAGMTLRAQNSHGKLVMESIHKNDAFLDFGGGPSPSPSPSSSVRDEESTQSVITGRVTRSAIRIESTTSNGEVKGRMLVEDATSARVTRSGAHKRNANMPDEVIEASGNKHKRTTRATPTENKLEFGTSKIEDNSKTYDEKATVSILTSSTLVTRSAARKGTGISDEASNDVETRQKTAVESLHSDVENQSQKKPISSKRQSLPSSPQPTSRPRTRSHANS